jgi:DNA-binding NarL/FixJ family response regulator
MSKTKIVIVDDSSFSVAFIQSILEENGFEVVGQAGSLEEVREVVAKTRPTLVTMDMTLPGTDGLECTRAVHEIDSGIKVIVISSMMDEEIIRAAKEARACAYLQKPIDASALVSTINKVVAHDELYEFLNEQYTAVFKEALMDGVNRMTKTLLEYSDGYSNSSEYESKGMSVIVGIIGEFSGRMLLDLANDTASALTAAMFKKAPDNNDQTVAALSEFANIIAGNACSVLNNLNKALGLRIAPPSVLYGDNIVISAPDFKTDTAIADTDYGEIMLNIGFKKGAGKWM